MKKAAALLIALLIIATLGTVALTAGSSVISGVGLTTALSDAMIAEQASQAGLEYGLLRYKANHDVVIPTTRLDLNSGNFILLTTLQPDTPYADITVSGADGLIESVGRFGRVSKKHTLSQE